MKLPIYALLLVCIEVVLGGNVVVQTTYGPIRGYESATSKNFLGVPYAAPPTGQRRWQSPTQPTSWSPNTYNATARKPGCPQVDCGLDNPHLICPNETSEDCLYLNVWTPLTASADSALPVIVYLHGGNFVHLSGSALLYDGEYFAMKANVIAVNVDYRMGALGFLYTGDGENDARGNYGIQDQRQALIWIQENIKNFGGDPNKVTLSGQSAGAQSTMVHMMSDKSAPYFQQAIVESAPVALPYKTKSEALILGRTIERLADCSAGDLACLRSKTAEEIAAAQHKARTKPASLKLAEYFEPIGPVIDGIEVPLEPTDAALYDRFRNIPLMIGTTTEEAYIFVYQAWSSPISARTYDEILLASKPSHFLQLLSEYPTTNRTDSRTDLSKVATDWLFTCSTRNVSQNFVKHKKPSIYTYVFDHAFSFDGWGNNSCCFHCKGHVCHGSEIPYVFHTAPLAGFTYTPGEEHLSQSLITYWSNFAYTSNPNQGPTKPDLDWPVYSLDKQWPMMYFETPKNKIEYDYRAHFCSFWDSIGYDE